MALIQKPPPPDGRTSDRGSRDAAVASSNGTGNEGAGYDGAGYDGSGYNGSGYEFTLRQNARIGRLASTMQYSSVALGLTMLLAVPMVAPAALDAARHGTMLTTGLPLVGGLTLPLVIALWTFRSAAPLRQIVKTEGRDVDWLMTALDELTRLYLMQLVLFAVAALGLLATLATSGAFSAATG